MGWSLQVVEPDDALIMVEMGEMVDEQQPTELREVDYIVDEKVVLYLVMDGVGDDDEVELVEIDEMLVMLVIICGDEFDDYDYVLV